MEKSFQSIIKNKLLFRNITRFIKEINLKNHNISIRFQDIYSLDWIIDNGYNDWLIRDYCKFIETRSTFLKLDSLKKFCKLESLDLDCFKPFYNHYKRTMVDDHVVIECLSSVANHRILDYVLSENLPFDSEALDVACINGHLDVLKKLYSHHDVKTFCTSAGYDGASRNGHLDVLIYIDQEMNPNLPLSIVALDEATRNGHTKVIDYLLKRKRPFSISALRGTIQNGNVVLFKQLEKLIDRKPPKGWAECLEFNVACERGHLEMTKFLVSKGYVKDLSDGTFLAAVVSNQVSIVLYLLKEFDFKDFTYALGQSCSHGHLEMTKLLYEHSKDQYPNTLARNALANNHKEVFYYLMNHTTKSFGLVQYNLIDTAIQYGRLEELKYLLGMVGEYEPTHLGMDKGAALGNIETIQFIDSRLPGPIYEAEALVGASNNGHYPVVEYLLSLKLVLDGGHYFDQTTLKDAFIGACNNGHLELSKYLFDHITSLPIEIPHSTIQDVCTSGNIKMLDYLLSKDLIHVTVYGMVMVRVPVESVYPLMVDLFIKHSGPKLTPHIPATLLTNGYYTYYKKLLDLGLIEENALDQSFSTHLIYNCIKKGNIEILKQIIELGIVEISTEQQNSWELTQFRPTIWHPVSLLHQKSLAFFKSTIEVKK